VSLRGRILVGSLLVAIVPLAVAVPIIRTDASRRFTDQDTQRAHDLVRLVKADLDHRDLALAQRLDALAQTMTDDNRFRLGTLDASPQDVAYVRDYAARQMSLMDMNMLRIQTADGIVVSSGHFRGAHDQVDTRLPSLLAKAPGGVALVTARSPEGSFLALARTRSVTLGDREFILVGGVRIDRLTLSTLNPGPQLALGIMWPGGSLATTDSLEERLRGGGEIVEIEYRLRRAGEVYRSEYIPVVHDGRLDSAWLLVVHDRSELNRLLREQMVTLAGAAVGAALLAVVLGMVLATNLSRPLRQLAARTEGLDLERLDVDFSSDRGDEVGRLTRLLGEMTARLREGVQQLREAEHRATLGEVSRQVNHDIRNGLTPLRNVLAHLEEVARDDPENLPRVFADRQSTLADGMAYLEALAGHYARLGGGRHPRHCRMAEFAAAALMARTPGRGVHLVNAVPSSLPPVLADPISLRRILDNLVRNALESLRPEGGAVTIDAAVDEDPNIGEPRILVTVSDDGRGIPPEDLDRIFNDFFTTKSGGTGLGLSNVRRLTADCGGSVRVHSVPGRGTTFTLSFPLPDGEPEEGDEET
jgi:signal transduction histidine kinase